MSRKINPISFRLGVLQLCKFSSQKYGKSFLAYSDTLYNNFYVYEYLCLLLKVNNLNFDIIEIKLRNRNVIIYLNYSSSNYLQKLDMLELERSLSKVFSFWFKIPIFISLYEKANYMNSANLIANYVSFSLSHKNKFKNILSNVYKILILHLNKEKIVFSKTGLLNLCLKGFKFVLTGCFMDSRAQMSKTIKCNFGSLSLTKLGNYVEYSVKEIHTKYGICSFQVWLIFKSKD